MRKILWIVLLLNAGMFVAEFLAGIAADSTGLIADSLDMLSDAVVYGISLFAVGRSALLKNRAALVNGSLQLILGVGVLGQILFKMMHGATPEFETMTLFSIMALVVNLICFSLLWQYRNGDINIRATWICSRNDMLANVGVLFSAFLVAQFHAAWPDWLIGGLIAIFVVRSAISIIKEARRSGLRNDASHNHSAQ